LRVDIRSNGRFIARKIEENVGNKVTENSVVQKGLVHHISKKRAGFALVTNGKKKRIALRSGGGIKRKKNSKRAFKTKPPAPTTTFLEGGQKNPGVSHLTSRRKFTPSRGNLHPENASKEGLNRTHGEKPRVNGRNKNSCRASQKTKGTNPQTWGLRYRRGVELHYLPKIE